MWEKYYNYHRRKYDIRYSDACIYTPDIYVIKTDTNIPQRMSQESWYKVDIITCAAPNLRNDPDMISRAELYNIHLQRAKKILSVAAVNSIDVLVLGAFGCGAFKNDPVIVAKALNNALKEFNGYFKHIEFAIFTASTEAENYKAFTEIFT